MRPQDLSASEITVVGLGRMGSALARALLAAGRKVTVWNRDGAKALPLGEAGARVAPSLADAISASPISLVCIGQYESWIAMLRALPEDVLSQHVVVQLSTGAADEAPPLEALHEARGARSLDGAIFAFPSAVGTGHCTIYLSGDAQAFTLVQTAIAPLGELRYLGEPIQLANALDGALLLFSFGSMMSYLQATALFEAAGLPIQQLAEPAEAVGGSLKSWIRSLTPALASGDYRGEDVTLNTLHDVWNLARAYADRSGLPSPLLRTFEALSQSAIDAGHGEAEFAAMIEAFRPRHAVARDPR